MVVALVTGGNTGIGEAVVRQLAKVPDFHVIVGSRSLEAGTLVADSLNKEGYSVSAVQLDITSDDSINKAKEHITNVHGKLDVLVNNAAILIDNVASSPRDLFSRTFETNVIGTAVWTEAVLPLLQKSDYPRVVFVSSQMGSLTCSTDETTFYHHIDYKAYDASKAAVNMLAVNYARILKPIGGVSNAVCPGLVKTRMNGYMDAGVPVEVGAQRIVELATAAPGGPSATFSNREGIVAW